MIILSTVEESSQTLKEFILVILKMGNKMDMENTVGRMGQFIEDILEMERDKEMANTTTLKIKALPEDIGRKDCSMEMENTLSPQERSIDAFGRIVKLNQ